MMPFSRLFPIVILSALVLGACTAPAPQPQTMKYPHQPVDDSGRISGPVMLLYEAAENEADPHNVIVIPPDRKTEENAE